MDTRKKDARRDGSALVLVLLFTLVLSWTLISYLYMVNTQRTLGARSVAWNGAIPVAEAGVEDALTQLYYQGTNYVATNGWMINGNQAYKSWLLYSGGPVSNYYFTRIDMSGVHPTIWSTGYVASPLANNTYIKRAVKVVAANATGVGATINSLGPINMSGGAYADNWNSQGGTIPYSTNLALHTAVVQTESTNNPAISLSGGAMIDGTAVTGAGGTITGGTSNNITGGGSSTANDQIDPVVLPAWATNGAGYTITTTNGIVGGTNYDIAMSSGNYKLSSIVLSGSQKMVVNGIVNVYLTSTGNNVLSVSGSGFIYLTTGSSLNLVSAGNITISGAGIVNGGQDAADCHISGLPSCQTVTYSGSADLYAVVDAPSAAFAFSGNEAAYGDFTVGSADISGSGGVHGDASLGSPAYLVLSWNEVPAQ